MIAMHWMGMIQMDLQVSVGPLWEFMIWVGKNETCLEKYVL